MFTKILWSVLFLFLFSKTEIDLEKVIIYFIWSWDFFLSLCFMKWKMKFKIRMQVIEKFSRHKNPVVLSKHAFRMKINNFILTCFCGQINSFWNQWIVSSCTTNRTTSHTHLRKRILETKNWQKWKIQIKKWMNVSY